MGLQRLDNVRRIFIFYRLASKNAGTMESNHAVSIITLMWEVTGNIANCVSGTGPKSTNS